MHPHIRRLLPALTIAIAASMPPVAAEETPNLWQDMARQDLEFIHDLIADEHPGPLNDDDEVFKAWHRQGLEQGLADLDAVRSYGGYRAVVRRYVAGFRDGHLSLYLQLDYRVAGWPGFVVTWRGGGFVVHSVADGRENPRVGDRLVSCDGKDADTLFAERVQPFAGNGTTADPYRLAPNMLVDRVNPLLDDVESCTFERGGETIELALEWEWPDVSVVNERVAAARVGKRGRFEAREVAENGWWISLPTFGPSGDDEARMKTILADLAGQRERDYIVVDVRGNSGGSSFWAEAFVRGLYGDAYFESLPNDDESYAIYRVSEANIAHFHDLLPMIEGQAGKDSDFYRYFDSLVLGMQAAREAGESLYEHRQDDPKERRKRKKSAEPLYDRPVFFLTDSVCGSACLDFADVVLPIPGVVHVGQPTNADTVYMEIRGVTLPSRNGRLSFATKFYRGRDRGHNESYTPTHDWVDDVWKTEAIERWVLDLRRVIALREANAE